MKATALFLVLLCIIISTFIPNFVHGQGYGVGGWGGGRMRHGGWWPGGGGGGGWWPGGGGGGGWWPGGGGGGGWWPGGGGWGRCRCKRWCNWREYPAGRCGWRRKRCCRRYGGGGHWW